jgi:hypothetical protein
MVAVAETGLAETKTIVAAMERACGLLVGAACRLIQFSFLLFSLVSQIENDRSLSDDTILYRCDDGQVLNLDEWEVPDSWGSSKF